MSAPWTVHLYLPSRRSICDKQAQPPSPVAADEFEAAYARDDDAPMCGACLVVVSSPRGSALIALRTHPNVWPATPAEAAESMQDTTWSSVADIAEHARLEASRQTSFLDLMARISPDDLDAVVAQNRARRADRLQEARSGTARMYD